VLLQTSIFSLPITTTVNKASAVDNWGAQRV
jgi:hypothetical protein